MKIILLITLLMSLGSCNSNSLVLRGGKIMCVSSSEFADAGYTFILEKSLEAKVSMTTFAGEIEVFSGKVILDNRLVFDSEKSLEIKIVGKNKLEVKKINKKNINDDFRFLSCNTSIDEIL